MSDEALNAHLDWLDKCAEEQGEDVLSNAVSLLKNENERLTKYVEYSKDDKECMQNEIDVLKRENKRYSGALYDAMCLQVEHDDDIFSDIRLDHLVGVALLKKPFTGGTTPAYFSAQNKEEVDDE